MPVPKHKPTTWSSEGATSQSSSPLVPEQEEFRQHVRRLAVSAVPVLEPIRITLEPHYLLAISHSVRSFW